MEHWAVQNCNKKDAGWKKYFSHLFVFFTVGMAVVLPTCECLLKSAFVDHDVR